MSGFRAWQIVHHDLADGLPDLGTCAAAGGVYLVLWLAEVPLGHLEIPADWLPLDAAELRDRVGLAIAPAVGHHLVGAGFEPPFPEIGAPARKTEPAALEQLLQDRPLARLSAKLERERADTAGPERPRVSVVICTRDRAADLTRCLTELSRCSPPADEVLVVDNAPGLGETRGVVARFAGVRYVAEPRAGLSAARNRGVRSATGEIIAFTDDDVEVHHRWISRVRRSFTRPDVLAMTGLVLPARLSAEPQWIFENEFGGFGQGYRSIDFDRSFFELGRRKGTPAWHIGAGANMAFRRRAFAEVGLFDERLGAGAAGCSEDSEFWYRLLAAGWACRYDPKAVVFHHHRESLQALRSQMYNYMRGHVATLLVQALRHRHPGNLYRLCVLLPGYYAKRAVLRSAYESPARRAMIPHEIRGCIAGLGYFLRHPTGAPPALDGRSGPS